MALGRAGVCYALAQHISLSIVIEVCFFPRLYNLQGQVKRWMPLGNSETFLRRTLRLGAAENLTSVVAYIGRYIALPIGFGGNEGIAIKTLQSVERALYIIT